MSVFTSGTSKKYPRLTFLMLLSVLTASGQWHYQKKFDSLYTLGEYDLLIKELTRQVKSNPKNEHALRGLGYVYIGKKDLATGEKYYSAALEINPRCSMCYMNLGKISILKKNNTEALKYFDKAIEAEPDNPFLYANRARFREYMGENIRASIDYNKAIALAPEKPEFYLHRGRYHAKQKLHASAILDYTKAIELDSAKFSPFFERAGVFYSLKNYDEAYADLTRAIARDSGQHALYTGRGAIFEVRNEHQKAIKDYSKAITLNPGDYLPYLNRANSLYKLERVDDACADYHAALEKFRQADLTDTAVSTEITESLDDLCDSSRVSYYYQRGIAYYNLKEYNRALQMYDRGLARFPESSMMHSFRGNALLSLEQFEKAIASYDLSLAYKGNISSELALNRRFFKATSAEKEEYIRGSVGTTYYSIAESQLYLGRFDQALDHINLALELVSEIKSINREAYYNLRGRIYLAQRKEKQAIADFSKSLSINKDFSAAYLNRAVASVNLLPKAGKKQVRGTVQYGNHALQTDWRSLRKGDKSSEAVLIAALQDCNAAIETDKEFGFAYYIRGLIKQLLAQSDYCADLLKAGSLKIQVEEDLLSSCR